MGTSLPAPCEFLAYKPYVAKTIVVNCLTKAVHLFYWMVTPTFLFPNMHQLIKVPHTNLGQTVSPCQEL